MCLYSQEFMQDDQAVGACLGRIEGASLPYIWVNKAPWHSLRYARQPPPSPWVALNPRVVVLAN